MIKDNGAARQRLLELAQQPETTPFDYIVVGSGAAGGPLAARLALGGRRVLVLEAGCDPAVADAGRGDPVTAEAVDPARWRERREVYKVPGYHAAATEDDRISWAFSVRHYENDTEQSADTKYDAGKDPSRHGGNGKGGIHYPRCAALGGCTAHYAMIVVRPNDSDWNDIAEATGDVSWRADVMQGYFGRLERCLYMEEYRAFLQEKLGWVYDSLVKLATLIKPVWQLDLAGHGVAGWQTTRFISPALILNIAKRDATFRNLLLKVVRAVLATGRTASMLKRALVRFQLPQFFDPNRLGVARSKLSITFIPTGIDRHGRRSGVREWLLQNAATHPERLVIETGAHVTRILFTRDPASEVPRAHGVELAEGLFLYAASPKWSGGAGRPAERRYFARQAVIICAGAFNTPQLLMLSGIGDAKHLGSMGIDGLHGVNGKVGEIVDLPAVGNNLQDRYEVSVISEVEQDFSTLAGTSFAPGDQQDPARREWLAQGSGLYATNGGALALFRTSPAAAGADPDLLIFGFPAAFRGYHWGWSGELLHRAKGGDREQRNLWSWVILKAYTRNQGGTVRLRSTSPFEQPEINFHSFQEGPAGHASDLDALADGIAYVRSLNFRTEGVIQAEVQPGVGRAAGSAALRDWIRHEAWGHHACGTCRIGPAAWQSDVARLSDQSRTAVLDSKFRVHGVSGLRVVDASVFPRIPGYFIVAATFMLGEKAADTLLADFPQYPQELEAVEASAVAARRAAARCAFADHPERLPADTVGLALSGGGIRSGTFSLGVLQALAAKDKLRGIDILSTVSGGGYIGGFLGRLFATLERNEGMDRVGHVQERLADSGSAEIRWLRKHADYVAPHGSADWRINLGIFWRNLLAVYLCVAALTLALFGALRWVSDAQWAQLAVQTQERFPASPFWWIPLAILGLGVVPGSLSFWLTPGDWTTRRYPVFPLLAWLVLLAGAVAAFIWPPARPWAALAIALLVLAWVWQEAARLHIPPEAPPQARSVIVRSRITRGVGGTLIAFLVVSAWVALDGLAWRVARSEFMPMVAVTMGGLAAALPAIRQALDWLVSRGEKGGNLRWQVLGRNTLAALVAFPLAGFLLFGIDVLAHAAFEASTWLGQFVVVLAVAFSLVAGRAFDVLNRSSLQSAYAERVARTFLGATNPDRTHPTRPDVSADVQFAHPRDDIDFDAYHPERMGGPLHLINVCVNETVDAGSGRDLHEDKGLPMCVGPLGISVGRRFHALWEDAAAAHKDVGSHLRDLLEGPDESMQTGGPDGSMTTRRVALRALSAAPDPNAFHVFGRKDRKAALAEPLRLSQWLGISAAAYTTGLGRGSSFPLALLLGLFNVRLGYWWDSGIRAGNRPGRYPPDIVDRVKALPSALFRMQSKLLAEWRGRFGGPSARHWYLTDGGHFEVSGLYELVRRRLPLMIAVDAGEDPEFKFEDLALLTRQTRMDFGAEFHWIDPTPLRQAGRKGWDAFDYAGGMLATPALIKQWFRPDAIGARPEIARTGAYAAALARITYGDAPGRESWLLLIKASAAGELPLDIQSYAAENERFPHESTFDQFFSNAQWESYRSLGQTLASRIFV